MQHTLINPNQLRQFGIIVKYDPYATDEPMCIEVEDVEFVMPLQSDGTVIYMDTLTPRDENLCSVPPVTITSTQPWNPRDIQFFKTSRHMQEELAMLSMVLVHTVPGDYSILISYHESEEGDFVYMILVISHVV